MAFDDIINEVEKTASKKTKDLGMQISNFAIKTIVDELIEHQDIITEGIVKKAAKKYDIYESTEQLIKVASTYAEKAKRNTIFSGDIEKATKAICPTYWPFC